MKRGNQANLFVNTHQEREEFLKLYEIIANLNKELISWMKLSESKRSWLEIK